MPIDNSEGITVSRFTARPSCFETIFCDTTTISPSSIPQLFEEIKISTKSLSGVISCLK